MSPEAVGTGVPAQPRHRAETLVFQRAAELLHTDSDIGRRAHTLTTRTAIIETLQLANAYVRAGGKTQAAASPGEAGHGIAMLPDVAGEALGLLANDVVLKRRRPELPPLLRPLLEKLAAVEPTFQLSDLATLRALISGLESTYHLDALAAMQDIIENEPGRLFDLEVATHILISDLKARGWTEQSLLRLLLSTTHLPFGEAFGSVRTTVTALPQLFNCYVAVTLTGVQAQMPRSSEFEVTDSTDSLPVALQGIPAQGPFVRARVRACDTAFAAELAMARVSAVVGALAAVVKQDVRIRSTVVTVVPSAGAASATDTRSVLPKDWRPTTPEQVTKLARNSLSIATHRHEDAVFDAIRHQQRAAEAPDLESRFMLLWLGIERLVMGSRQYGRILEAVREIVPRVISLGKIRREVSGFCRSLDHIRFNQEDRRRLDAVAGLAQPGPRKRVDRDRVLRFMLSPEEESRVFSATFYEKDVRLTQWYAHLRKRLNGGDGTSIAEYIEESRLRIERQVMRLYRARNSVAHAARGPAWLADLTRHANHYLSNLISIALYYREEAVNRTPVEIFMERCGQYDAYIALLKQGSERALQPSVLLRPTDVVGFAGTP